jgi:ribosome biogenesis GTPase A
MQNLGIFNCLSFQDNDLLLSEDFREKLQKSSNRLIIMFIGSFEVGKSQRVNQILTKNLCSQSPFRTIGGISPITRNFQACGPLSF